MPEYRFHLTDGHASEDYAVDLDDDASATAEGLKTASRVLADLRFLDVTRTNQLLEVRAGDNTILKIEVKVIKNR
jgi:hypothetical protein